MSKVKFTRAEQNFLERNEACRVATCMSNIPHVVPVSYIFANSTFIFATDYETKKLENIKQNRHVALTVDVYSSVGNKAVCVQGIAEIVESGAEYETLYRMFHKKFGWVRKDPWKQGEAPFVKVTPRTKV
ncbi:MAG: pyridoxamine 5'-phosphate oxidase family protein, partial [Nitrososphaera sp.]|nr:pyridoxamine 5'-phosphate oxidase family protein [Nitrososphaera sp.]